MSPSLLQRTYKEHGVKFKYIQKVKKDGDFSNPQYLSLFLEMDRELDDARIQGRKIVYLDEAIFTFNTFNTRAWAASR